MTNIAGSTMRHGVIIIHHHQQVITQQRPQTALFNTPEYILHEWIFILQSAVEYPVSLFHVVDIYP